MLNTREIIQITIQINTAIIDQLQKAFRVNVIKFINLLYLIICNWCPDNQNKDTTTQKPVGD